MPDSPNIKFLYVRDPACEGRVLTVARRIVGQQVEITYCANRAHLSAIALREDAYQPRWVIHDRFEKSRARMITTARFGHAARIMRLPYRQGHIITDILHLFCDRGIKTEAGFVDYASHVPLELSKLAARADVAGNPKLLKKKVRKLKPLEPPAT